MLHDGEWRCHSTLQENILNTNTFWRTPEGVELKIKTGLNPSCWTPVRTTVYPGANLTLVLNIQGKTSLKFQQEKPWRVSTSSITKKIFSSKTYISLMIGALFMTIFRLIQINSIAGQKCKWWTQSPQGEQVLWPSIMTHKQTPG